MHRSKRTLLSHFLVSAVLLFSACHALAVTTEWRLSPSTQGDWHDDGNWSVGSPDYRTNVIIANSGTAVLSQDASINLIDISDGSLIHTAGTLQVANIFKLTGGTLSTYTLSGTGYLRGGDELISGVAYHDGGTNYAVNLAVYGSYELNNGTLDAGNHDIKGIFSQKGGVSSNQFLQVDAGGTYIYRGGQLGFLDLNLLGTMDFGDTAYTFTDNGNGGIFNISGALIGTANMAAAFSNKSLIIVSPEFDTKSFGAGIDNQGVIAVRGANTVISADRVISGNGTVDAALTLRGTLAVRQGLRDGGAINIAADIAIEGGTLDCGIGDVQTWDKSSLTGGSMTARNHNVVGGNFVQSGGNSVINGSLVVKDVTTRQGLYELKDNGNLVATDVSIGAPNMKTAGTFIQSSGSLSAQTLMVNWGSYELSGGDVSVSNYTWLTGTLDFKSSDASMTVGGMADFSNGLLAGMENATLIGKANSLLIFASGFDPSASFGHFENEGITHITGTVMQVPQDKGFVGSGSINDLVETSGTVAAEAGAGINLDAGLKLYRGNVELGSGRLCVEGDSVITGGSLLCTKQYVGNWKDGQMEQSSGTSVTQRELYIGVGGNGKYVLSGDGILEARNEYLGYGTGTGSFLQTGGSNSTLSLAVGYISSGNFEISGGEFIVRDLYVGDCEESATGSFAITGPADIFVTNDFVIGSRGSFSAVPGSKVYLPGANFKVLTTSEQDAAGFNNLSLIFQGGTKLVKTLEVAGLDMGDTEDGMAGNFALDLLQLGEGDLVGKVQLVDETANHLTLQELPEALYVKTLIINPGSELDLAGLNLYCYSFINNGSIIGGDVIQVTPIPEPISMIGMLLGGTIMMWKRKR